MVFNISAIILDDICFKNNYFLYTFKLYRLSEVSEVGPVNKNAKTLFVEM